MLDEVLLSTLLALTGALLIGTTGIAVATDGAAAAPAAQPGSHDQCKERW